MFFTIFLKNANFKFHKTAQLFWRPKRPSRTQPSARLLYEFCKKHIFYIFSKKLNFQNPQDSAVILVSQATVLAAAKGQIIIWFLKIIHFSFFFSKKCKFQKSQDSAVTGCQNWTVQKRAKIQILLWIFKF